MNELPWVWIGLRMSGLVAYGALWASMWFGLAVAARGAGGWLHPASATELHRQWSLAALAATGAHALATAASVWERGLEGELVMGVFAAGAMAAAGVSSAGERRLSPSAWRAVHALVFGAWVLATVHTFVAGSDTQLAGVRAALLGSVAALVGAFALRIATALQRPVDPAAGRAADPARVGTVAARPPPSEQPG